MRKNVSWGGVQGRGVVVWWLSEIVHEVLKNLGQPLLDGGYSHGNGPTSCTEGMRTFG